MVPSLSSSSQADVSPHPPSGTPAASVFAAEEHRKRQLLNRLCRIAFGAALAGSIVLVMTGFFPEASLDIETLFGVILLGGLLTSSSLSLWANATGRYGLACRTLTYTLLLEVYVAYTAFGTASPLLLAFMLPIALSIVLLETREVVVIVVVTVGVVGLLYVLQNVLELYHPLLGLDFYGRIGSGITVIIVVLPTVAILLLTAFKTQIRALQIQNERLVRALTETKAVLDFATELKETAGQQATGSVRQAMTVSDLRHTSDLLLQTATHITTLTEQVRHAADQTTTQSAQIEQTTTVAARAGQNGTAAVRRTVAASTEVAAFYSNLVALLAEVDRQNTATGYILDKLETIGDDTQLVAVNAIIEAAGAGAYGQRFQIVAEEVGKLAAQTIAFSKEVLQIVQDIRASTAAAVAVAQQGYQKMTDMAHIAAETGVVMEELGQVAERSEAQASAIHRMVQSVSTLTAAVGAATRQQQSASQQVQTALVELGIVAEGNATGSRIVSATATRLESVSRKLNETLLPDAVGR